MSEQLRDTILTNEPAERMVDRVTPIYSNSYVGLWLFEVIGREYAKLWTIAEEIPLQLFPESATWALPLWEQRYNIVPGEEQTIDERRQRLIAARSIPRPFTHSLLIKYILNMTGRQAEVFDHVDSYTFGVYINSTDGMAETDYPVIKAYIDRHKPSHMSVDFAFQSAATIVLEQEESTQGNYGFIYNYLLCGTFVAGAQDDV